MAISSYSVFQDHDGMLMENAKKEKQSFQIIMQALMIRI